MDLPSPNGEPSGRKLASNAERAERDRAIAAHHLAGMPWKEICQKYGVSRSTAKRAARALAPSLRPIAEEQVRSYRDVDVEMIVSLGVEAVAVALDKGLAQLRAEDEPDPKLMSAVSRLFTSATTNVYGGTAVTAAEAQKVWSAGSGGTHDAQEHEDPEKRH
jgi:hypothetical protein